MNSAFQNSEAITSSRTMSPSPAALAAIVSIVVSAVAVLLCFLWSRNRKALAISRAHLIRTPGLAERGQMGPPVPPKTSLKPLILSERAIAESFAQAYDQQHIQGEPLSPDTVDGLASPTDNPRFQRPWPSPESQASLMPVFPDRVFDKTGRPISPCTPRQPQRRSGNSIRDPFSDLEEIELDDFTSLPFATKDSLSAVTRPGPRQSHPRGPSYIINGTVQATKPKVSIRKNIGTTRAASPVVYRSRTWCR